MSYTPPLGNAASITWQGAGAYTPPAGNATGVSWAQTSVSGAGAVTLALTAAGVATHGVAGAGAVTLALTAAGTDTHIGSAITGTGAATLGLNAAGTAAHGVAGTGEGTLSLAVSAAAAHGVASTGVAALQLTAAGSAAHGVAGAGGITLALAATGAATHQRYELRGEVRQGGVLVNRRVRAYVRSTGQLIGEADTVAGHFALHAGFSSAAEHYVTPIDLSDTATDWLPPTANRVLPVLAMDT